MTHNDIVNALQTLALRSHWNLSGDTLDGIVWLDDISTRPTDDAIMAQIAAYVPPPTLQDQIDTLQAQVAALSAAEPAQGNP